MADYRSPRRYYHRQRLTSRVLQDGLEEVWRWKQEQQPGNALPADFPFVAELTALGYTTLEDLDGADAFELQRLGGFGRREATIVVDTYAQLRLSGTVPSPLPQG